MAARVAPNWRKDLQNDVQGAPKELKKVSRKLPEHTPRSSSTRTETRDPNSSQMSQKHKKYNGFSETRSLQTWISKGPKSTSHDIPRWHDHMLMTTRKRTQLGKANQS